MPTNRVVGRVTVTLGLLLLLGPALAAAAPPRESATLAGLGLPFVANEGQAAPDVAYYAPTFAGTLFVTGTGQLVYSLSGTAVPSGRRWSTGPGWTVTETFVGGGARPVGYDQGSTKVSSFVGSDPARWRTGVSTYERVGLGEVWPGVTVALQARGKNVEKVFTVEPGGSTERIQLRVDGARRLTVDGEGALVADTPNGPVKFTAPVAYQERHGVRQSVAVAYRSQGMSYGFTVGPHDPQAPLVIDPLLQSTFLGGNSVDQALNVAVHPGTGDVYVVGFTASANFPGIAGGAQTNVENGLAFVARLSRDLKTLIQATFLGGTSGSDYISVIRFSPNGDVYVAGFTGSADFPGTTGGAQPVFGGPDLDPNTGLGGDGFIARLNEPLTALFQATYLGGTDYEEITGLVIDGIYIYASGLTLSPDFPGTVGGAQPTHGGDLDGFLARLSVGLTSLTQATYLGGTVDDFILDMVQHPSNRDLYVVGGTSSDVFPGTSGGAQPVKAAGQDGFVSRVPTTLTAFTQSTFFGGAGADQFNALVIDRTSDVIAGGNSNSTDLPGAATGFQPTFAGGTRDAALARFPASLTSLTRSTYFGGNGTDGIAFMDLHPLGSDVYVTSTTTSTNLPGTAGAPQPSLNGARDVFVARVHTSLAKPAQATYLGGSNLESTGGVAVHQQTGEAFVAGLTRSADFPQTAGGAQPLPSGPTTATIPTIDAFVTRLTLGPPILCCKDFNGDARADILSRNASSGVVDLWLINGTSIIGTGVVGTVPPDWTIAGQGDFNGDGKGDILWRHSSGAVAVWLLDGNVIVAAVALGTVPLDWAIVGVGDFNGDGRADILWRQLSSGNVAIWLLNGATIIGTPVLGTVPLDWAIVGVGDFNGDGRADILWRQLSSGNVAIWLLNGATIIGTPVLGTVPLDWAIVGAGDFNGDGRADILWRHNSGIVAIWLVNGATIIGTGELGTVPFWAIVGIGDFNGDGRADILLRRITGTLVIWLLNGTSLIGSGVVGTVPPDWGIE